MDDRTTSREHANFWFRIQEIQDEFERTEARSIIMDGYAKFEVGESKCIIEFKKNSYYSGLEGMAAQNLLIIFISHPATTE